MLLRRTGPDLVAISQPAHAWLSGQLARAWGNAGFLPPEPREEVCLGAEQHDIGWMNWETAPTLNPETGLPHVFHELRPEQHVALWRRGVELAQAFGLYPALLVSLHAKTIYGNFFDFGKAPADDAAIVRAFLKEQDEFRNDAVTRLRPLRRYAGLMSDEQIERNRLLVGAVDRLSLELCWGVETAKTVPDVPALAGERVTLTVRPRRDAVDPLSLEMAPWPFDRDRMVLVVQGRRLEADDAFTDEAAMREALRNAPVVALEMTILPA